MRGKAGKRLPSTAIRWAQRGVLGQQQVRAQAGPQRGQDRVQQGRVEDVGRFLQGTQGRRADPGRSCGGQGRRLLQAT